MKEKIALFFIQLFMVAAVVAIIVIGAKYIELVNENVEKPACAVLG